MRNTMYCAGPFTRRPFPFYSALAASTTTFTGTVVAGPKPRRVSPNEVS